jgi:peptidyl-prolyl cis-trans isomerase SurA
MQLKKLIFFLLIIFIYPSNLFSIENKILLRLENEIITSMDVYNETKYLSALNSEISKLDKNQIFELSKNSIMRHKIKKIEILKNGIELKVDDEYLDRLVKASYSKIGINNLDDFNKYMFSFDVNIKDVRDKMIIDALWNNLIFKKFSSKIKINKENIEKEISESIKTSSLSYFLYEILFNVSDSSLLEKKYKDIKKSIAESSFKNAALIHSISSSSSIGGNIGWVSENSINKKINKQLSTLENGQYSKPILTPSGFLILMIEDKKKIENKINLEDELKKVINLKTNQQFNQFSNMYFNKIKKNLTINEL